MLRDTLICDFGWKAPDFTLKDPDGKACTMSRNLGDKGLLIAFICNHCPYVQAIATRLAADTQTLMDEGIPVAAVMSNEDRSVSADSPANMKRFAAQHGFAFPYLVDDVRMGSAALRVASPSCATPCARSRKPARGPNGKWRAWGVPSSGADQRCPGSSRRSEERSVKALPRIAILLPLTEFRIPVAFVSLQHRPGQEM